MGIENSNPRDYGAVEDHPDSLRNYPPGIAEQVLRDRIRVLRVEIERCNEVLATLGSSAESEQLQMDSLVVREARCQQLLQEFGDSYS